MKNLKILSVGVVGLFISINACKKSEQRKFIEEISGAYTISSITLSKSDLITDSITLTSAGEFFFANCKIDANKSRGFCEGYYIYNNEPKFNFGYTLANETGEDRLLIQPNNSPTTIASGELNVLGAYDFIEKSDNQLTLRSVSSISVNKTRAKVTMTLIKKQ